MKKLMIALAAATTAMFSFGDFTSTGFENSPYVAGELLSTTNDDAGRTSIDGDFAATWVALPPDEDVQHTIKAFGTEGAEATPANYADAVGNNYLWVETTSSLLQRNVQPGGAAASIGDGIYLDTLVKFTPADQPFVESDVADGDKIAISYVGQDPSEVGDGETPISNIVVRAGYVSGSTIVPTNYVMNLPDNADFDVNAWHRLTVRSIANVGSTAAPVGFAIYIDGNKKPLTYASDVAAGDSAYVGSLNAAVQTYLYNGEKHALLPSLVNSGENKTTITTVGFKGSGCVDNLAFTADPGFIEEGTAVEIAWDEGVATYTVVDSTNKTLVDGAATGGTEGSTNLLLEVGITYLTVTATYGTGYEAGTWTVTGDGAAISGGTFTVAEGAKLNINSMTPKFDVGGVHYGSFDAALDAAAGDDEAGMGTIKLLVDVVGDNEVSDGWVTIDLAGKTITGVTDAAIINSGATLFITNSTAEIGHVAAGDAGQAVLLTGGETTIYAGWFDGDVFVDGGALSVYGGYYLDANAAETVDDFYLLNGDYVTGGKDEVSYYGDNYFLVGESEQPPAPTTFALTTTGGANATVTTSPANVSALTEETEVTITATAAQDYTYDDVDLTGTDWTYDPQADAISMTTNISENTTVVVPDAVSEQSSDDWPTGQDLDDAEGKAAGDLFPGITNALATADAKAVATWAEAKGVAYADKGGILPEAFLLDCANTQAAIDEAAANFKVTAITVVGDTVTITPADGADYGNGKVVIEGTATLSPISWHEKTDGDHFFRATLVVKPVAVP